MELYTWEYEGKQYAGKKSPLIESKRGVEMTDLEIVQSCDNPELKAEVGK